MPGKLKVDDVKEYENISSSNSNVERGQLNPIRIQVDKTNFRRPNSKYAEDVWILSYGNQNLTSAEKETLNNLLSKYANSSMDRLENVRILNTNPD